MPDVTAGERDALRGYLLGKLGETEANEVEDRFVCEHAFYDAYLEAERLLIRDYATDALDSGDAQLFERNYLITGERRNQLAIVRALISVQNEQSVVRFGQTRPVYKIALALASAAFIFLAGAYWSHWYSERNSGRVTVASKGGTPPGKGPTAPAQKGTVPKPPPRKQPDSREIFYTAFVPRDRRLPTRLPPSRREGPPSVGAIPVIPVSTEAVHLGLRYNLVLVDSNTGRTQPAAPDRLFHAGECFAINFQSNRAGFLYVLDKQSSGTWQPLVPLATESNEIVPGRTIRVPRRDCFEIKNPPGVETIFVVLSREPRDSSQLYESMKGTLAPTENPKRPDGVMLASAGVPNSEVERMRERYGTRDISIKTVSRPLAPAEPPESVYVVNASSDALLNLAAQIEIHHP